jgi:hypothetical protein
MKQALIHDLLPLPILSDDAILPFTFLADVFSVRSNPDTAVEFQAFVFAVNGDGGVSCAFDGGGVFLVCGAE